ncbi:hypothetical protein JJD41_16030 [Oxynema sp. CENA135]|uniref:hypothetical protein n=1 Tax=Oxynema sp. CENA135 TaxID=984206 RepID=UPI00190A6A62|nr:hypothetical protein [Oxynema sp. CENA135]MBK4731358.1 hypothetical protein [Oxynema sp. CENA135]
MFDEPHGDRAARTVLPLRAIGPLFPRFDCNGIIWRSPGRSQGHECLIQQNLLFILLYPYFLLRELMSYE